MNEKIRGPFYMCLSALSFATMGSFTKALSQDSFSTFQILFFRGIVGAIILFFTAKTGELSFGGKTSRGRKLLFIRAIFGTTGAVLYFFAISKINLANAVLLNNLSPFWVTILAWMFLKEKPSKKGMIYLVVILIGAILVIKPKMDFSIIPSLLGFASSFFAGAAYTYVRYLRKLDNSSNIVFWFSLYSAIFMLPLMFMETFIVPNFYQLLLLSAVGICGALGQIFLTSAYRIAPVNEVSIYQYLNIIFAAIYGVLLWHQIPDSLSLIGGFIILGSAYLNFYEHKKKRELI
ncbi:DMT family transporter [Cetobacterium sp. 2A]|uniref:DMT family transporter n=1 Tax=unclassified Cetobacterium TaxID=2630983 RepID=UPI00163D128B|nr:DMT family transporter [Cetobacterium sp. 2A]MBC2857315.1 DMT family transporter [Cetobacterium sp. 2A]